jgi:surface protein
MLYCNNQAVCEKLLSVEQWGDGTRTAYLSAMFKGATNLAIHATDIPNFSSVTRMDSMFQNATHLTGNFSGWNTSSVARMQNMFEGATDFDADLSSWSVAGMGNYFTAFLGANTGASNPKLSTYNYNQLLIAW